MRTMTYPIITSVDVQTILSHWVLEAMSDLNLSLDDTLQAYLVELLKESVTDPDLVSRYQRLGFSWLESLQPNASSHQLHRVGKDSLLMAGLFLLKVNTNRLNDCCVVGIHAYRSLAGNKDVNQGAFYAQCADHFKPLIYVIDWINYRQRIRQ
jgi:hypothetical protein